MVGNDGKGSSQDDIGERLHDRQKTALSSDSNVTEQAIKKANYYIEYSFHLKNELYQNCGACKRRSHMCDIGCDLSKVTRRVVTVLRKSRYMEKVPDRPYVEDINGKVIPDNRTPLFSEAKGKESLALNIPNAMNVLPFECHLNIAFESDSGIQVSESTTVELSISSSDSSALSSS